MKRKMPIPKELIDELKGNVYIERVTERTISFTEEFKKLAYDEYHSGKSIREIFIQAGFDVEKLGKKRLENFQVQLMKKAGSEDGFCDKRKDKSKQAPLSTEAQMMKRIRELEHRNAYLEQENDFLKKIQNLEETYGMKAVKQK